MKPVSLEPIVTFFVGEFPFADADLHEFPWKGRYESLKKNYKREIYSICVDDLVAGGILLEYGDDPELIFFEVEPRWRGRGVGQAALDLLFRELRLKHCDRLVVQTGRPTIYSRMGYQFKEIDQGHIVIDLHNPRPQAQHNPEATTCFIYSPRYLVHDYPDHPEHDGRVEYTMTRLKKEGLVSGANIIAPVQATEEELLEVHAPELVDRVKKCSQNGERFTRDTPAGPETFDIAGLSFGGALLAGRLIEQYRRIFVLGRPPGHHAFHDHGGGFCFFNNMAGLALSLHKRGLKPMIVDWDVHHGNGTQEILYELPIMYASFHQKYLYPHTGAEDETGSGPGAGYTRNFPLPIGIGDEEYVRLFRAVHDLAAEIKPDVLLISAGQDGHYQDRLSGVKLTSQAYHEMGRIVGEAAQTHCEGRIILLLEGGYHLEANAEALAMAVRGIRETTDGL